ncbi:MAG: hypothetical protein ABR573_12000 [Candidatus Dormibacteria bacterium]
MKTYRNPATMHAPVATYSHQVDIEGNCRWLLRSEQVNGVTRDARRIVRHLIARQRRDRAATQGGGMPQPLT